MSARVWESCAVKSFLAVLLFAMFLSPFAQAAGPVRHVVHFKFKADAPKAEIEKVVAAFAALPSKIKEIDGFEWGTNVSPEGLDQGFTHCWIISFKTEADRDLYLKHPDHDAFVAILKPVLEAAFVVDFIPQPKS
jgi:hypothetical protein